MGCWRAVEVEAEVDGTEEGSSVAGLGEGADEGLVGEEEGWEDVSCGVSSDASGSSAAQSTTGSRSKLSRTRSRAVHDDRDSSMKHSGTSDKVYAVVFSGKYVYETQKTHHSVPSGAYRAPDT